MSETGQRRINPWSIWAMVAIMLGGLLVYYNWLKTVERQMREGRPPRIRPVEKFRADDHRGRTAELFAADGKMYLVGYLYADDEVEALKVCRRLEAMRKPFGKVGGLFLVGVSMAPDVDTPERLAAFAEKHGFSGDEWIFLTGDRERIRNYMNKFFRYPGREKPEDQRERPTDLYARELRISLVDGKSEIRGVYWDGPAEGEVSNDKRAVHDIRYLIENETPDGGAETPDE